MNSKIRREVTWLCLPLVLIVGAGAWFSHAQSERNAEKQRRESGPTRVRVWGISIADVVGDDKTSVKGAGYDYGVSIRGDVEGDDIGALMPGQSWMMRVKSVQIRSGKTSKRRALFK